MTGLYLFLVTRTTWSVLVRLSIADARELVSQGWTVQVVA